MSEGWLATKWTEVISERGDRGDKSGSGAEAVRKRRRDKDGTRTGLSGSARERDWVVGLQILTVN